MTTEVEILIIEIPGIIETGSLVVIVEIPETGLTEVTVGIDFVLEAMIIEIITGKTTSEAPVKNGILAKKDMIDPMTRETCEYCHRTSHTAKHCYKLKRAYNYYKEINEPNPDKSETAQMSQADNPACYYEHPTN